MAASQNVTLEDEPNFRTLSQGIAELQSMARDAGIERQSMQHSVSQEEYEKSKKDDNEEESLKIIKQTTETTRAAMILLVRSLLTYASYASGKSRYFSNLSSAVSYIRAQQDLCQAPKHLLLQWERNLILIDIFTSDEGLYCNKRIAQNMFDICMETFEWLHSLAKNNK